MGFDCINTFREGVRKSDVEEFLLILGYCKMSRKDFLYYKDDDYKHRDGVEAYLDLEAVPLKLHTRTSVWRSKADHDIHNFTIRQLYKRFGGSFRSDFGTGRYLIYNRPVREKAEAGCYNARVQFHENMVRVRVYLRSRPANVSPPNPELMKEGFVFLNHMNWIIISNNLVVPYMVSCIEDYFKETYLALLKYSPQKQVALKKYRILTDDFLNISEGNTTIERALVSHMSFQNISKICEYFKEIDKDLDFAGELKRPFHNRKESLYETIDIILNQRHELIHQNSLNVRYSDQSVQRDLISIEAAVDRVYKRLLARFQWAEGAPW